MHKTEEGCLLYELGTWSEYSGVRVECIVLGLDCTKRIPPSPSSCVLIPWHPYHHQLGHLLLTHQFLTTARQQAIVLSAKQRTKKLLQEGCNDFVMWWWCLLHQSFCLWSLLCPFNEVLMWWGMSQGRKIQFLNLNSAVFTNPVTFDPQSVLLLNLWSRIKSYNNHKLLENGLKYLFLYALNATITQCDWYLSSTLLWNYIAKENQQTMDFPC